MKSRLLEITEERQNHYERLFALNREEWEILTKADCTDEEHSDFSMFTDSTRLPKQKGQKADKPKRNRRTKAEMERDVIAAIRYLIDEEYNGVTQRGAEQRYGLPARILSKGQWAEMIEKYRKMR